MDQRIDLGFLSLLEEALPSPEEAEAVVHLPGEAKDMDATDLFLRDMARLDMPRLRERIELHRAVLQFNGAIDNPVRILSAVISSCHRLEQSPGFRSALGVVLAIGNSFNGGTHLGGARGFSFNSLPLLEDMTSRYRDGSLLSVLQMILLELEASTDSSNSETGEHWGGDCLNFDLGLTSMLRHAAGFRPAHVEKQVKDIESLILTVRRGMATLPVLQVPGGATHDTIKVVLEDWLAVQEPLAVALRGLLTEANEAVTACFAFFGQGTTVPVEPLFGPVLGFLEGFRRVAEDEPRKRRLHTQWDFIMSDAVELACDHYEAKHDCCHGIHDSLAREGRESEAEQWRQQGAQKPRRHHLYAHILGHPEPNPIPSLQQFVDTRTSMPRSNAKPLKDFESSMLSRPEAAPGVRLQRN